MLLTGRSLAASRSRTRTRRSTTPLKRIFGQDEDIGAAHEPGKAVFRLEHSHVFCEVAERD